MGNKLFSTYSTEKTPLTEAQGWRLFSGVSKDRSEQKVTLFAYEKGNTSSNERPTNVLRKDASTLQKLRHPRILSVVDTLVDERGVLAFTVRPVTCTLKDLLGSGAGSGRLAVLEARGGLLDIAEGIVFLHEAGIAHLNISPESIFVTANGRWVLGGFGISESGCKSSAISSFSPATDPTWQYSAPELSQGKFCMQSDLFSFGLLIWELLSTEGRPLLPGNLDKFSHERELRKKLPAPVNALPSAVGGLVKDLLEWDPHKRGGLGSVISGEFWNDIHLKSLRFLDSLSEKDENQKIQFLSGLGRLLGENSILIESRLLRERVIPALANGLTSGSGIWHSILSLMLPLLKKASDKSLNQLWFEIKVWPLLRPLFAAREIKLETVLLILSSLDVIAELAPKKDAGEILTPFILKCLEIPDENLLGSLVPKIPFICDTVLDEKIVKDGVLTRMLNLLGSAGIGGPGGRKVKGQVLQALLVMATRFDKQILETIIAALERMAVIDRISDGVSERDYPGSAFLGLNLEISKILGTKITAQKILPLLIPMLVEDGLGPEGYREYSGAVEKLFSGVGDVRRKEMAGRVDRGREVREVLGSKVPPPPKKTEDFETLIGMTGTTAEVKPQSRVSATGFSEPFDFNKPRVSDTKTDDFFSEQNFTNFQVARTDDLFKGLAAPASSVSSNPSIFSSNRPMFSGNAALPPVVDLCASKSADPFAELMLEIKK